MPAFVVAAPVSATDHTQGSDDAPITLVEYGDYQCPYCGAAYAVIEAVQKRLGGKLRFVFRSFPLNQAHPMAELAAESAEAADSQGRFWEMHDALYENQDQLGQPLIEALVARLKLDADQFAADLESRKFQSHVKRDFMGGVRSGVNGTPGFFINGERYDGNLEEEPLMAALQESLRSPRVQCQCRNLVRALDRTPQYGCTHRVLGLIALKLPVHNHLPTH